ncbi:SMI1/KNR4 family protein [Nonomuraea sp. NPDC005983]|uniref:SMI1/KNR4 family protein n=1 Tax=Nonomuraea sp. NPDC005983 TaxID=3155595 RepID=UPI0033BC4D2A
MRRLITSRGVWLALGAAIAAAAIVALVRSRRRPTGGRPVRQDEAAASYPAETESGPGSRWPPVPILGTPTAEDLKRYDSKPSVVDRPTFARIFSAGEPGEPLDEAARRRLTRWGMAGLTLLLLAVGTQTLESAVFSKETGVEVFAETSTEYADAVQDEPCAACLFAAIDTDSAPDSDHVPQPSEGGETQEPVPADESSPDADCRPKTADPRVRTLNAKVTRAVDRQWQRIEAWLKTNAPRSYRTLGKPGKAETIAAAEAQMGVRFPDDLRASLLRHDGAVMMKDTWGFGFLGHENLSVLRIRDTWRSLCEIDAEDEGGVEFSDPRTEWWDGRMLPIGANGMGDHLVIDSVKRDVGYTDHEGSMSFTPGGGRIRSYYALLKATADAMENGGSVGYWKPQAVAGELDWKVL